jgi:predicted dehydrogenase
VTVRAGILGTGWIAQEHAIAIAAVPGVEVVGVASQLKSRSDAFVTKYQTGRVFTYDELLGSSDIDVVHICTRNAQHHDQTLSGTREARRG